MRHGREGIESRAGEGDEDCLVVREARELVVVEDWELDGGEVKPLAGLANKGGDVKVVF